MKGAAVLRHSDQPRAARIERHQQPLAGELPDGAVDARVKDKLENRLHELVCAGRLSLPEAQKAIATDWITAYRRFVESQASD